MKSDTSEQEDKIGRNNDNLLMFLPLRKPGHFCSAGFSFNFNYSIKSII